MHEHFDSDDLRAGLRTFDEFDRGADRGQQPSTCWRSVPTTILTCSNNNNDTDTDFETAMKAINNIMPNPGTGASGSTPQEVLFLVTDGVDDEMNSSSCSQTLDGTRCQQPFNTAMCTTVKNRGIRIAVLYTEYLPLPTNAWYNTWISPFQSQIGPNMQSCASPGLFFQVTTDGDITAAMQALFQQAVSTARLSRIGVTPAPCRGDGVQQLGGVRGAR